MFKKKFKRIIALMIFASALVAVNPFNAAPAVTSVNVTNAFAFSGNSAFFSGTVTADANVPYSVGFEYTNTIGWPSTGYVSSPHFYNEATSGQAFSLTVNNLPNGVYRVRAFAQFGGTTLFSTNTVTFTVPGYNWDFPGSPGWPGWPGGPSFPSGPNWPLYPSQGGRPAIASSSVLAVTDTTATIEIDVSSNGSSLVSSRGIVYSSSNRNPVLGSGIAVAIGGTTGVGTASLHNLARNTTFYFRPYATNAFGTTYGDVRTFATSFDESVISTVDVTNITATTAVANGCVYNPQNYLITERGFVYSDRNTLPVIGNQRVFEIHNSNSGSNVNYSRTITGLKPGTAYNIRAYVKTSTGSIFYGRPLSFTTALSGVSTQPTPVPPGWFAPQLPSVNAANIEITLTYNDLNGAAVGSQTIFALQNQIISRTDLILPSGYTLQNPTWQYRVIGAASISVIVTEGTEEANFMPVGGGFMFRPDEFISRVEVAQILYNLSNKVIGPNPGVYPDVKNDQRKIAIDFATSNNYMSGYADGRFVPAGSVTRADIAIILCNFYNIVGTPTVTFKDIDRDHWAYHYIALAAEYGFMNAFPDGYFRANDQLTRAEATVVFSIAENRTLDPITIVGFSDVFEDHWAYKYIMNAATPVQ